MNSELVARLQEAGQQHKGSVPYRAILKGRKGGGSELNPTYFMDQVHYLKSAEKQFQMPSLFDVMEEEIAEAA